MKKPRRKKKVTITYANGTQLTIHATNPEIWTNKLNGTLTRITWNRANVDYLDLTNAIAVQVGR